MSLAEARARGKLGKNEIVREDGLRIERICAHGVGHPVRMTRPLTPNEEKWVWVHGCCGRDGEACCDRWMREEK